MTEFTIVDLSVTLSQLMPKFPGTWLPAFTYAEAEPPASQRQRRFTTLNLCAHVGTHVESSDHVMSKGMTIDTVPLHSFAGFPIVVDLRDVHDAREVGVEVIRARLDHDHTEPGRIVLLMTGYNDRRWGETDFWEQSPWLSLEAAEYIASLRPALIGFDFQTEKPFDREFPVHRALLSHERVLCEYLFNLEHIGEQTLFLALPIKVAGVEAAVTRAVGINGVTAR